MIDVVLLAHKAVEVSHDKTTPNKKYYGLKAAVY